MSSAIGYISYLPIGVFDLILCDYCVVFHPEDWRELLTDSDWWRMLSSEASKAPASSFSTVIIFFLVYCIRIVLKTVLLYFFFNCFVLLKWMTTKSSNHFVSIAFFVAVELAFHKNFKLFFLYRLWFALIFFLHPLWFV